MNPDKYSSTDLFNVERVTARYALDPTAPSSITSVLATPDGSIHQALGNYTGGKLPKVTVPDGRRYARYDEPPGALVHQPRAAAGVPDPAEAPDAPPPRRGPFPNDDRTQVERNIDTFSDSYEESITTLPRHVPENLVETGMRGAKVGALTGGATSFARELADDGRIDDTEAVRVASDTITGAGGRRHQQRVRGHRGPGDRRSVRSRRAGERREDVRPGRREGHPATEGYRAGHEARAGSCLRHRGARRVRRCRCRRHRRWAL